MSDESSREYHANPAISHSKLEVYRKRPRLFFKRFVERSLPDQEPTKALQLGSLTHGMVLEPEKLKTEFVVAPRFDRRTKDGKAEAEKFEADAKGKTVVDQETYDVAFAMSNAVDQNPLASQLLAGGTPERTWRTKIGGLELQCRTDWFNPSGCELSEGRPYVVDLKTTESLSADGYGSFEKSVFSYGYHRQAGFYLPLITEIFGKPVFDFFFIAVEKVQPYGVAIYKLSDQAISIGQDETLDDLRRLKKSIETNYWENIEPVVRPLDLPKWYRKEAQA